MTLDQLQPAARDQLGAICVANRSNLQAAVLAAYEAGLLQGALNVAQRFAAAGGSVPTAPGTQQAPAAGLSAGDRQLLRGQGVDPDRQFRIRNTVFTITGYQASRWKYPISATSHNGTAYKFTAAQVQRAQG